VKKKNPPDSKEELKRKRSGKKALSEWVKGTVFTTVREKKKNVQKKKTWGKGPNGPICILKRELCRKKKQEGERGVWKGRGRN